MEPVEPADSTWLSSAAVVTDGDQIRAGRFRWQVGGELPQAFASYRRQLVAAGWSLRAEWGGGTRQSAELAKDSRRLVVTYTRHDPDALLVDVAIGPAAD